MSTVTSPVKPPQPLLQGGKLRADTGAVPVEFAAAVGLLLFPVVVFVMSIAPVVERRNVAGRAAAEAARAFATATNAESGVVAAQSIVDQINATHPFELSLSIDANLDRGSSVTAEVKVAMPIVLFPGVDRIDVGTYAATHREEVDLFRSLPPP